MDKYLEELQREEGFGELAAAGEDASAPLPDTWWSPQFIGVAPHRLGVFQAALESGVFACSSQPDRRIAFSQVNDDYCDCPADGADEPGTEACAALVSSPLLQQPAADDVDEQPVIASRFFCRFQLPGAAAGLSSAAAAAFDYDAENLRTIPLQWTPHSRVNDGICDCCDGSDEWRNSSTLTVSAAISASVASSSSSSSSSKGRVPCANTCGALVKALKDRLVAQREGKSLKEKYILEAKRHFR